jgi:hypothetical protein
MNISPFIYSTLGPLTHPSPRWGEGWGEGGGRQMLAFMQGLGIKFKGSDKHEG